MATPVDKGDNEAAVALAAELVGRWLPLLRDGSWAERLALLNQIHEQLQEDLEDIELYSQVSPLFIRDIINELAEAQIDSKEQAHIYANSGAPEHRRAAGEWFARQPRKEPSSPG